MIYYGKLPEEPKNPCECNQFTECWGCYKSRKRADYLTRLEVYQSFMSALRPVDIKGLADYIYSETCCKPITIQQSINKYLEAKG